MNVSPDVIEDDDVVMVINDDTKSSGLKQDASTTADTINLDEEPTPTNESTVTNSDKESSFARLLKNNSLMNKIVHQCLNMANNTGMSRVINKTLLPSYADTNTKFKESEQFTELLKSSLKKLRNDPDYKFLHLKTLCEDLKSGRCRKKVPFVTLSKELKGENRKRSFPQPSEKNRRRSPRKRYNTRAAKSICKESDIINLDNSDDDDEIRVITDVDGENDDIMIVDETANSDVGSEQSNKENSNDVEETNKTPNTKAPSEGLVPKNNSTGSKISHCDLLVPKKAVKPDQYSRDYNRCFAIEQQILLYQEKILQLEEAEVESNCLSSPYLLCDKYKAKIVVEGHPPGPVKRLERFLNNTIDETGVVPLPDLHDVVRCVTQSNIVDQLGWSKQEIMKEAIALFTQCCHALRKSRQRREYKDLMSLVRDKSLDDYDPAKEDPHLCAKLEENKIIAKANENEILERYVKMEYMPNCSQTLTPRLGNMSRLKDAEYTDTESDGDLDLTLSKKIETHEFRSQVRPDHEKAQETATRSIETSSNIHESKICNTKHKNELPSSTEKVQDNVVNINRVQDAIDTILKKALTAITVTDSIPSAQPKINMINNTTRDTTNITAQNIVKSIKSNTTTTHTISEITTNCVPNQTSTTSQNVTSTIVQKSSNTVTQTQRRHSLSNTIQKIGSSNMYVVSYQSNDNSEQNGLCSDVKLEKRDDLKAIEMNPDTSEKPDVRVKTEDVTIKQEPIDINSLLHSLGDNYISTIFDIEDPFLVVEISSDSSDDEL
ncbi:unnamed protein product [Arctia plantaginis]|uniref:Daxx histone-binding domain-containing protein n=1 Tax=Arctia plantaginis TaxID=874455 RepID=A0A8S1B3W7_ARCPL|nr:unnamed protein product [Arctia plantaginis]